MGKKPKGSSNKEAMSGSPSDSKHCSSLRANGLPCGGWAIRGGTTCFNHSPKLAKKMAKAAKKGSRHSALRRLQDNDVDLGIGELDYSSPAGLLKIMAALTGKVLAGKLDATRARNLVDMVGKILTGLRELGTGGEIGARLAALRIAITRLEENGGSGK